MTYRLVTSADIEHTLSPLAVEVYDALREEHPDDHSLDRFQVGFTHIPGEFGVHSIADDSSQVLVMSTSLRGLSTQRYGRFVRVAGPFVTYLPKRHFQKVLQAFIWGHECAHLMQESAAHRKLYGVITPYTGAALEDYVLSDEEVNADFMAMRALAHTSVAAEVSLQVPHQDPCDWREWQADQRRKFDQMIQVVGSQR